MSPLGYPSARLLPRRAFLVAPAAPEATHVFNAASSMPASLLGHPIALGSMFIATGINMGSLSVRQRTLSTTVRRIGLLLLFSRHISIFCLGTVFGTVKGWPTAEVHLNGFQYL